jgi:electron transfer flavoprotein beta subunit
MSTPSGGLTVWEKGGSMETIVCVKRVPETADMDIVVDKTGRDIEREGLVFDINE